MTWIVLWFLLLVPESLSLPPTAPDETAGPASLGLVTGLSPPPSAADVDSTPRPDPSAPLPPVAVGYWRTGTSETTTVSERETEKSKETLFPPQVMQSTEINPRHKRQRYNMANGDMLQRSAPIDMRGRLDNGHAIPSTSFSPNAQPSTQGARDSTEETSTASAGSYFKRSTMPSQNAAAGLSTSTPRFSDIREVATTKLPSSEAPRTDARTYSGTEVSTTGSKHGSTIPTTLSSIHPVLTPPESRFPSSTTTPITEPVDQTASTSSHHSATQPIPSSTHHSMPASASPSASPRASTAPTATTSSQSLPNLSQPSEAPAAPSAIPVETTPADDSPAMPQPEPMPSVLPAVPEVECASELTRDAQLWRAGTDIQINFPLTIPGECTPAEQCSVSTVLDQRVTVQTTDTVTVRFVVSARGGVAPAAASLALRRADPGTSDCPLERGVAPPALLVSANQRQRLGSDLLRPGVNNFFGRISLASEECFRLVVTVRSADCGDDRIPCGGRGHCVATPDQETFVCSCCSGASGRYCEASDPCAEQPCTKGATCIADGSAYKCICPEDGTGSNCSHSANPTCDTCLNGGTCVATDRSTEHVVRCLCPAGYTGERCQETEETDEETMLCSPSPCLRGECRTEEDGVVCVCPPGYRGQYCETADPCGSAPCRYGGTCHVQEDGTSFNCSCAAGFRGSVCQFRVLPLCTVHPCANGGTCWDEGTTYYCTCQHGFSGKHCEVPPGLIGHFDIHHMRSGVPIMAALSVGLFLVIAVVGCCYCRSVGGRQSLGRLFRPVARYSSAVRCCPRRTYKQFSDDQRKNLLEMGYSHSHQPIVEPIYADVDCSEAPEAPLIT